jgi:hypothetical protein
MTQRVCGRWLLALLAVVTIGACRSESDGVSWTTTTTTSVTYPPTLPNPPTTYRTVLPMTTTRTAPSTTTTAPGVVDRLGLAPTIANGDFLRIVGKCPYGSDYVSLSLAFATPEGQPVGAGISASTSTWAGQKGDGSVSALAGVNLPPGNYVVQAQCVVERTPPPKVFTPFNITVTGDRVPTPLPPIPPKEWRVVLRGDEAHPRVVSGAECWKHDGRIVMVNRGEGGFSSTFEMPEDAVVSAEPVIRSTHCEAR